jgi:glycosyltransferase involved in cell wall biosynthesis
MMVSVIVPNYNHALYLEERIESIINQTYQDFELLILDDCSTDNSREIIDKYKNHPKVTQIIYNSFNSGSPFIQWALGISLSKGSYVWIAESDDWAEANFLEILVNRLVMNQEIGLSFCDSIVHNIDGSTTYFSKINNNFTKTTKWSESYTINGIIDLPLLTAFCFINNASAVLFRREILAKVIENQPSFNYMGDWFIYIKIALNYKIDYCALPLNNYRFHSANTTRKSIQDLAYVRERFIICDYLFKKKYTNQKELIKHFLDYTVHRVDLKKKTIMIYKDLFLINPLLLIILLRHNIYNSFKNIVKSKLKNAL